MSSYAPRQTGNHNHNHTLTTTSTSLLRHPSTGGATTSTALSTSNTHSQTHLQTRIAAKRAELENLRQLRDLSGELASQLAALEQKLSTLRDGAQSVALVLANWDNVLRAIGMAAVKVPVPMPAERESDLEDGDSSSQDKNPELPVPLVRIPVQQKTEDGG
ncbi:hypothetical protein LTR84_002016 [Exophiala bonariae]|uniref:DASH complex subunit DAD2 n=1 Tax=Exophiala bonariae TaxID=1690606 RepID=A0AAV9NE23_9EURO|nr:hypothetical protein LTR84_002016 [Exophiala bonariae]